MHCCVVSKELSAPCTSRNYSRFFMLFSSYSRLLFISSTSCISSSMTKPHRQPLYVSARGCRHTIPTAKVHTLCAQIPHAFACLKKCVFGRKLKRQRYPESTVYLLCQRLAKTPSKTPLIRANFDGDFDTIWCVHSAVKVVPTPGRRGSATNRLNQ